MRKIEADQFRRRREGRNNPKTRFAQSCHNNKKSAPVRTPDAGHTVLAPECFSFDIERLIPNDFLCLLGGNLVACDMSEIGCVPIKVELRTQSILYKAAPARSTAPPRTPETEQPDQPVCKIEQKCSIIRFERKRIPPQGKVNRAAEQAWIPLAAGARSGKPRYPLPPRALYDRQGLKKEIGPGLLADMCRQLGYSKEDL
jgi:hypothetical protein